jgi:PAS domain S-box-containing protein
MTFDFPLFSFIFLLGGLVCLFLAAAVWARRPAPGIVPLTMLLLAAAVWTIPCAFEAGATQLSTRIICSQIAYIGVVSTGVFWLAFVLDYSGANWWKQPRNFILLSIIPVITLAIAWTNGLHGWLWSSVYLTEGPLGITSIWEHGPWFLVNPVYQYGLYLCGMVILLRFGVQRPRIYWKPVLICLIGTVIPMVGSMLYVFRVDLAGGFDITPFYISAAAILYSVAICCYRFVDVLPVAYPVILRDIPDGVLVLDAQANLVAMNPAAERCIGGPEKAYKGRSLAAVLPELEKVVHAADELFHTELKTDKSNLPEYLDVSVGTLRNKQNNQVGKLVIFRDISELKTLQLKLTALYKKEYELNIDLQDEIKKRSQYSRAVVHELKVPLSSIILSTELLEDQLKDEIPIKLIHNIRRSSLNLEQRVNELFELARGELGLISIDPTTLDIRQLINEIMAEMSPLVAEKGLLLSSEITTVNSLVKGEQGRLRQVIINLLSNAIKFTRQGEIKIVVDKYNSDYLVIRVVDSGSGMDKVLLENLFDPYRRKTRDKYRSTGLGIGLGLCKIIVELHQGKIWAESAPGKGTTISFTIPYAKQNGASTQD